jgi:hypothetical protein
MATPSNTTMNTAVAMCQGYAEIHVHVVNDLIRFKSLSTRLSPAGIPELHVAYYARMLARTQSTRAAASESSRSCITPKIRLEIGGVTVNQTELSSLCSEQVHTVRGSVTYDLQGPGPQVRVGSTIRLELMYPQIQGERKEKERPDVSSNITEISKQPLDAPHARMWLSDEGRRVSYSICLVSRAVQQHSELAARSGLMTMILASVSQDNVRYVWTKTHKWKSLHHDCLESSFDVQHRDWPLADTWLNLGLELCGEVQNGVCKQENIIELLSVMAFIQEADGVTQISLSESAHGGEEILNTASAASMSAAHLSTAMHETIVTFINTQDQCFWQTFGFYVHFSASV